MTSLLVVPPNVSMHSRSGISLLLIAGALGAACGDSDPAPGSPVVTVDGGTTLPDAPVAPPVDAACPPPDAPVQPARCRADATNPPPDVVVAPDGPRLDAGVDAANVGTEKWSWASYAVGEEPKNETAAGTYYMPDLVRLTDGRLRLYYVHGDNTGDRIKVAESNDDGVSWTVKGIAISGSPTKTDRNFRQGGPSVVELPDGTFRMYMRATEDYGTGLPKFHVRSAISTDGLTFTAESGIRIEITPYDPSSTFTIAGHGRYFRTADGKYVGIFSGNLTTDLGPSDLHLATSDDGLTWGGFKSLYADYHDPVVIKVGTGYVMYAMYLKSWVARFDSPDGITWPEAPTAKLVLQKAGVDLSLDGLGDFGAVVLGNGTWELYSNFGIDLSGPVRNIARYTKP